MTERERERPRFRVERWRQLIQIYTKKTEKSARGPANGMVVALNRCAAAAVWSAACATAFLSPPAAWPLLLSASRQSAVSIRASCATGKNPQLVGDNGITRGH